MKTETLTEAKPLDHLRQLAIRSYNWISQDPDGRGQRCLASWNAEIETDINTIKAKGANDEQIERYKKGYEKLLSAWYHSQSNCASSFVCGPANFPVAKQNKRRNWADNHYNTFRQWREKVLNAYSKYERKAKIEAAGGELEIAKKKLDRLEDIQLHMKRVNKAHTAYVKNPNSILNNTELSDSERDIVIHYIPQYSWIKHPFSPSQLTGNNALIKNTKERIATLEKKESNAAGGNKIHQLEGFQVILNYELDRLQIKHEEKPEAEVIKNLKSHGFRWSPFHKVWQRQLTNNALWVLKQYLKIEI